MTDLRGPTDHFGPEVAARYDDPDDPMFDADATGRSADVLAELAGDGGALELAIGTGRIALPLAERGVEVEGVDLSPAMLAQLRAKPGGAAIPTVEGDMASIRLGRTFGLVYLVFNTIGNVITQEGQTAVFLTAAAHLRPGGCFVVEVGIPDLQRLARGDRFRPFTVTADHLGIDEYDVLTQRMVSHHYGRRDGEPGLHLRSIPFRYVWPAELDLMARLAGMRLRHRWAGWDRRPLAAADTSHVSVWEMPGPQ